MSLILEVKTKKENGGTTSCDGPIHLINSITGEEGTINVLNVGKNSVSLAIDMPNSTRILRDKLYQKGVR